MSDDIRVMRMCGTLLAGLTWRYTMESPRDFDKRFPNHAANKLWELCRNPDDFDKWWVRDAVIALTNCNLRWEAWGYQIVDAIQSTKFQSADNVWGELLRLGGYEGLQERDALIATLKRVLAAADPASDVKSSALVRLNELVGK